MANINVFMMGGRRCGKTTTLALIRENFNNILHHDDYNEGHDLFHLATEAGNIPHLNDAIEALAHYFSDDYDPYSEFTVDDNRGNDISETVMKLNPINKGESLTITFKDIPGEWFSDAEQDERIKAWIQEAQVLILAIDTPSLFAENGYYAEYYNRIKNISEHLKGALSGEFMGSQFSDKMLLFVPLKSEVKIIDKKGECSVEGMKEVNQKVKEYYADIINHFQQDSYREKMTMAILPISTISELRWEKFGCTVDGQETSIHKENGEPRHFDLHFDIKNHPYSIYIFRSPQLFEKAKRNGSRSYFCEQPLIYSLVYMFRLVILKKASKKSSLIDIILSPILEKLKGIFERFGHLFSNKDYEQELSRLKTKKMRRQNGFEIIQNPLDI